jgi:hypothetical protein
MIHLGIPPTEALRPFSPYLRVTGADVGHNFAHLLDAMSCALHKGWYDQNSFVPDRWTTDTLHCVVPQRFYLISTDSADPPLQLLADLGVSSLVAFRDVSAWAIEGTATVSSLNLPTPLTSDFLSHFLDIVHQSAICALVEASPDSDWRIQVLLVSALVLECRLTLAQALAWLQLCRFHPLERENLTLLKEVLGPIQGHTQWTSPSAHVSPPHSPEGPGFSRAAQRQKRATEGFGDLVGSIRQDGHPRAASPNMLHGKNGVRRRPRRCSTSDLDEPDKD